MKQGFGIVTVILAIVYLAGCSSAPKIGHPTSDPFTCSCDSLQALSLNADSSYIGIGNFYKTAFEADSLYALSAEENKALWYQDIQNPYPSKFTPFWNSYVPANYHANHKEFLEYFTEKEQIELAFQFGPNFDLWAFNTFVLKKLDCCYLLTRTYFRHARFTYKSYSFLNTNKLDSLYQVIASLETIHPDSLDPDSNNGHFVDNRSKQKFAVNFSKEFADEKGNSLKPVEVLDDFLFNHIDWKATYE